MKRTRSFLAALIGLVMALSAGLLAVAAPASAVDVSTGTTFTNVRFDGAPPTQINSPFSVDLDWAVADNSVHAGDTFTFTFPVNVGAYASSFPLLSPGGETVADCQVQGSTFTCTFTDFVDANPLNIKGTLQLQLAMTAATQAGSVVMLKNGDVEYSLDFPSDVSGGSGPGGGTFQPVDTLTKDGYTAPDGKIYWNINIPPSKLVDASNNPVTLVDTIDSRLVIPDSFAFDRADATTYPGNIAIPVGTGPGQVSYTITDAHTVEFVFHDPSVFPADSQIHIQYATVPPAGTANGTIFTNTVTGMTTVTVEVPFITSGGTGDGTSVGRINVTKVDALDTSKFLANATFEVRDSSNNLVAILVTDSNGKATVGNLVPGVYTLKETAAPPGYTPESRTFSYQVQAGIAVDETVTNMPSTGSVVVSKVDSADVSKVLAGAEFELRDGNGDVVAAVGPTGADGSARLDNVPAGDYTLVETTAPTGYDLDAAPIAVTVVAGQTSPAAVVVTNTLKTGDVVDPPAGPQDPSVTQPTAPPTAAPAAPAAPTAPAAAAPAAPGSANGPIVETGGQSVGSPVWGFAFLAALAAALVAAAALVLTRKRSR